MNRIKKYEDLSKLSRQILEFLNQHRSARTAEIEAHTFIGITLAEMSYYMDTVQPEKLVEYQSQIQDGIKQYKNFIIDSHAFNMYFFMAESHFMLKDYDACWQILQFILSKKSNVREDILHAARIYICLLLYDKGESLLLENHLNNLYNSLYKKEMLDKLTKCIVSHFKKLLNAPGFKEKKAILKAFQTQLEEAFKQTDEGWVHEFVPLKKWIKAHVNEIGLIDIAKENAVKDPFKESYKSSFFRQGEEKFAFPI